ncbi:hypothetical protein EI555_013498 [Monodon monoceros]|uniref:Uncharacterized protein n=1 Tax=Monodon monoceros TaxID=40151 RepID=A0A4U1F4A8_MONMO|nr:hypothetical protein EI555_013498 [Monodon monoceros]
MLQQLPLARPARPGGDRQQDIETSDSGPPSESRPPPVPAWWSHERLLSGCLERFGRTLRTLSCGCCRSIFGA